MIGLLDSGSFSDSPEDRPTPEGCLERQFHWERESLRFWGYPWMAEAFVSQDLLIDEKWTGKSRKKQRWSVKEADHAVRVTVEAAGYLSRQRKQISPRQLVLACQGVDCIQYLECATGVLAHAQSGDIFGLGGWCILGVQKSWIPTFWATARRILPLIESKGISRVHIFGVMYRPVLGPLLWLCDRHGLALSTDSSGPVLSTTWKNQKRAGILAPTWEENVRLWREALANLRTSEHYREPSAGYALRQTTLFS